MADTSLDTKLAALARQYDEVAAQLATPEVLDATPTSSSASGASSRAWSRSSRRTASWARSASSSPARVTCATPRRTRR